jgi:hypothetical protein
MAKSCMASFEACQDNILLIDEAKTYKPLNVQMDERDLRTCGRDDRSFWGDCSEAGQGRGA